MGPRRRRQIALGAAVTTALVLIAAACTFPEVTFGVAPAAEGGPGEAGVDANADQDSGNVTPPTEGGADSGTDAAADADAESLSDGAADGTVQTVDATVIDAAGCDAKCDCDDDGYYRTGCNASTAFDLPEAGRFGTGDCDDTNDAIHPGYGDKYLPNRPSPPNLGDWDCDKVVEKYYSEVPCPSGTVGGACKNQVTFQKSVKCGEEAPLIQCVPNVLACDKVQFKLSEPQACQ